MDRLLYTYIFMFFSANLFSQIDCLSILVKAEGTYSNGELKQSLSILQDVEICDYNNKLLSKRQKLQIKIFEAIETQKKVAEQQTRTAVANDLAYKASNILQKGDRTKAFQLANFAHQYLDSNNSKIIQALHDAYYYNNHPSRHQNKNKQKSWYRNFMGFGEKVNTIAFSPNGDFFLTGNSDGVLSLWEVETGKEVRRFEKHSSFIRTTNFSPDGRYIISGGNEGVLNLWEVETGKEVRRFEGQNSPIESANFSPDGQTIISGNENGVIKLWDITGNERRSFQGHDDNISTVSFSPNGQFFLSAGGGMVIFEGMYLFSTGSKSVKLWDVETGDSIKTFEGNNEGVEAAVFSPDGQYILTGNENGKVNLWDIETGNEVKSFEVNTSINSLSFSSNGKNILIGGGDNIVRLWEVETGDLLKTFEADDSFLKAVSFSPDEKYILTGGDNAKLWTIETGNELTIFEGHNNKINSLNFSTDQKYIVSGSGEISGKDNTARLWEVKTGKEVRSLKGISEAVLTASFSPDGRYILSGGGALMQEMGPLIFGNSDNTMKLWEVDTGKEIRNFKGHNSIIWSANFSFDSRYIITGSQDKTAKLWEVDTGKEIRSFDGHLSPIRSVRFSPDNQYIITGSINGVSKLWEVDTGKEIQSFRGHSAGIAEVDFSPDGQYIITGSFDGIVKLWEIETGKEIRSFVGHEYGVQSASFSSDGRFILTSSGLKKAKLWNVETGDLVKEIEGCGHGLTTASFSPDDNYIIIGCNDYKAKLWVNNPSILLDNSPPLAYFTLRDIQEYDLYELLLTGRQWNEYLNTAMPQQLLLFGIYLREKVENTNNPVIFNDYYQEAVRCFEKVVSIESERKSYLVNCYQTWGIKLYKQEEYLLAKEKLETAFELNPTFEIGKFLYHIAKKMGEPFDTQVWLGIDDSFQLKTIGAFFYNQDDGLAAIPYLKKCNSLGSSFENDAFLNLLHKSIGKNYDLNKWLETNNTEELLSYTEILYRLELFEETLEFAKKVLALKNNLNNRNMVYILCEKIEQDCFNEIYLTGNIETNKENIDQFINSEVSTKDDKVSKYEKLYHLSKYALTLQNTLNELSDFKNYCNSYAWYLLLTGNFEDCEKTIRQGIQVAPEHSYFYTNLAPALLLQGKYNEAINEYEKWKDKPFDADNRFPNYSAVFLDDLITFENEGIITDELRPQVRAIINLLNEK